MTAAYVMVMVLTRPAVVALRVNLVYQMVTVTVMVMF